MSRGGRRVGAGRKPGVPNKATRAAIEYVDAAPGHSLAEKLEHVLGDEEIPVPIKLVVCGYYNGLTKAEIVRLANGAPDAEAQCRG